MRASTVTSLEPLRIAHVINEPFGPESANGVQQVVYCLANALAETGRLVAVFSREGGGVHELGRGAAAIRPLAATMAITRGRSARQRLLSRYFEADLAETLLAWHPDIVHFHSVHIVRNIALAACLAQAGIPYCVTVHGGLFRAALRRAWLKKAVLHLVAERHYLNGALFIHALSPAEADVIRRRGVQQSIVVIPNGLPPAAGVPPSRPDALYEQWAWLRGRKVFMFIGRLDPWQKGLDLLIEAFANASLHDTALVLIGPDCRGSRRVLEDLAGRLGVSREVLFTGPAFGEDRANLFAAADVFVHPSRWEGVSLSVLAAAAAGKPCLLTRQSDPMGQLERAEAAIIVDPTVSSIAGGLRRAAMLLEQERQTMGERARQVADAHFNWRSIAETLADVYRSALENARVPHLDQTSRQLQS
jgi:glycosyltransferase involved in cell wall biosynthesis